MDFRRDTVDTSTRRRSGVATLAQLVERSFRKAQVRSSSLRGGFAEIAVSTAEWPVLEIESIMDSP